VHFHACFTVRKVWAKRARFEWQQVERQLDRQEEEEEEEEAQTGKEDDATNTSTNATATIEQQVQQHVEMIIPKDELQLQLEQLVQDMSISSTRIQEGLGLVTKSVDESDQLRKQLYQTYRQDHQFHGYQGVSNPRGLIRFLSQEQPQD
jgi:hypothetical protein